MRRADLSLSWDWNRSEMALQGGRKVCGGDKTRPTSLSGPKPWLGPVALVRCSLGQIVPAGY